MQSALREETGVSAAEAALQQQLVVPGQLPLPGERPAQTWRSYQHCRWSYRLRCAPTPKRQRVHHWMGRIWVYVAKGGAQRPMADKYSGPYKVLELANKAWKVQVGKKVEIISRDRLKPHLGSVDPVAARPPTLGRPRTASVTSVASSASAKRPGGPV